MAFDDVCAFCEGPSDDEYPLPQVKLSNGVTVPAHPGCATDWERDRAEGLEDEDYPR